MPLPMSQFSEPVRAILAGMDHRPFPLVRTSADEDSGSLLDGRSAVDLFPSARYPQEALSGLFLRLNNWEKSHQLSQELDTVEGSYWHGIAHRLEPDYSNAGYWFRRVGQHPIFPQLQVAASEVLAGHRTPWRLGESWDPFLFNRWCEEATRGGDAAKLTVAIAIQEAEWELLFEWCGAGT